MLRFVAVIALTLAIAYGSTQLNFDLSRRVQPRIYEAQINETLKNISRDLAQNDPRSIAKVAFDVGEGQLRLSFSAEDILIIGYSKFYATNLKISVIPPTMLFNIQFPKIQLVVPTYSLDLLAVFVPLYGSGNINLLTTSLNLGGRAKVKYGDGGIEGISDTKLQFSVEKFNFMISGLLHNEPLSQIVSTAISECFPEFIQTHGDRFGEIAGKYLEDAINGMLAPSAP